MNSFLNTKIYTDSTTKPSRIDSLDIPIINLDNAVVYLPLGGEYRDTFKLPEIDSGITIHKGQYYLFTHNIVRTPKGFRSRNIQNQCHSYNIYPITSDAALGIINSETNYYYWEVYLNSQYHYGVSYLSIKDLYGSVYNEEIKSYMKDGDLYIDHGSSPSGLRQGITIGDYISYNKKNYQGQKLIFNKEVFRDILLSDIGI